MSLERQLSTNSEKFDSVDSEIANCSECAEFLDSQEERKKENIVGGRGGGTRASLAYVTRYVTLGFRIKLAAKDNAFRFFAPFCVKVGDVTTQRRPEAGLAADNVRVASLRSSQPARSLSMKMHDVSPRRDEAQLASVVDFYCFPFFFTPLSFPTGIRFPAPLSLARSLARTHAL